MEKRTLSDLTAALEEHRQNLVRFSACATNEARHFTKDEPQDSADQSIFNSERELLFDQSSRNNEKLRMIEAALDRIKEGTFGACIACGDDIGIRRLTALPWTKYYLHCQESIERERRETRAA